MQGEITNEPALNVSGFVQLLCKRTPTGGGSIVGKRRKEFSNGFGLCPRMIYITLDALFNPPKL